MNKLYETDSYMRETKTRVTGCEKTERGIYAMFEDAIFFPHEGGQYADTGAVVWNEKKIELIDGIVFEDELSGESLVKYLVSEEIPVGSEVLLVLDWEKRFMRMQNHTGEHILTGVIHNKYGFDNVGFHLSDDDFVTLDLNGVLSYEEVIQLEETANEVIYSNYPVKDSYPTDSELAEINYRSKKDIKGQVRLITIGNENNTIDICACCAPHVKQTGEVGIIKVVSVINWKGGIQISMLAGKRALKFINEEQDIVREVSRKLSTNMVNISTAIDLNRNEVMRLTNELIAETQGRAFDQIDLLDNGDAHIIFVSENAGSVVMKNVFNALCEKFADYVGVFSGNDEKGYMYYAGSCNLDSKILANKMREKLDAKGGGSSRMIQGKINVSRKNILDFFGND